MNLSATKYLFYPPPPPINRLVLVFPGQNAAGRSSHLPPLSPMVLHLLPPLVPMRVTLQKPTICCLHSLKNPLSHKHYPNQYSIIPSPHIWAHHNPVTTHDLHTLLITKVCSLLPREVPSALSSPPPPAARICTSLLPRGALKGT